MRLIKNTIKAIFRKAGIEIHRYIPGISPTAQIASSLMNFEIDLVLDIGANKGQFASELRSVGYKGEIVSFEPLSDAHQHLEKLSRVDAKWQVSERAAIGDFDGEIKINISGNSVSSSVLPMTNAHSSAAKDSAYISEEIVPIFKLDTISKEYINQFKKPFLKIDTQGFEWEVLDGAKHILPYIQGVLCEVSLVPLYEGQYLWKDMIRRLENEGFKLWIIQQGFWDQRDGRTLQLDCTFFRL